MSISMFLQISLSICFILSFQCFFWLNFNFDIPSSVDCFCSFYCSYWIYFVIFFFTMSKCPYVLLYKCFNWFMHRHFSYQDQSTDHFFTFFSAHEDNKTSSLNHIWMSNILCLFKIFTRLFSNKNKILSTYRLQNK